MLEPLSGYLTLAEKLYISGDEYAEGWNFGPNAEDVVSVGEVLDYLVEKWREPVSWALSKDEQPHEAQLLKLDTSKATKRLKWKPIWNLGKTLSTIIEWDTEFIEGANMAEITLKQIKEYQEIMVRL